MKRGALVGAFFVAALAFEYWHGLHTGLRPGAAGYGVGIVAALLCVPFGYVFIYGVAEPIFGLLHCCESQSVNMATIAFGVFLNCFLLGTIAQWGARRFSK